MSMSKLLWILVTMALISYSTDIPFDKNKWDENHEIEH